MTLLGSLVFLAGVSGEDLTIYTNDNPPMQFLDKDYNVMGGAGVEIVREIQRRIGDSSPILGVPWARGYAAVQSQPNVLLFSTVRNQERENLFKWVGPLFISRGILVSLKSRHLKIGSFDNAAQLDSIGTVSNDARGQILKSKGLKNLDEVNDASINVEKLLKGRIDAFASTNVLYQSQIREAKADPADFEPVFTIAQTPVCLSFSLKTPDETVGRWDRAFKDMSKDGTLSKLLKKVLPDEGD